MITPRKSEDRGHAKHGWLDSYHTFSFADYHDPRHLHFRSLRVINEDRIAGGGGFGTHPHRDMEIITVVLSGALQHRDSLGNSSIIQPGEVQQLSAGTGVEHSEFNPSPSEPVHLLQIWILPSRKGLPPSYAQQKFDAKVLQGRLPLVCSEDGRAGSIRINQIADLFVGKFAAGETTQHLLEPGRHAWVQIAAGKITLNGQTLHAGDGAGISDEAALDLKALESSHVLLFDLN